MKPTFQLAGEAEVLFGGRAVTFDLVRDRVGVGVLVIEESLSVFLGPFFSRLFFFFCCCVCRPYAGKEKRDAARAGRGRGKSVLVCFFQEERKNNQQQQKHPTNKSK